MKCPAEPGGVVRNNRREQCRQKRRRTATAVKLRRVRKAGSEPDHGHRGLAERISVTILI